MESPEKVAEYISQWLTDYVEKIKYEGICELGFLKL